MSGTSLDGVDAVLADLSATAPKVLAHVHAGIDAALRAELLALCHPGGNEIERTALAANRLAELYAVAVGQLLDGAGIANREVRAIGCHGQTVRHRPDRSYSVQIGNPARLAERSGIAVVADFRSRDIAAGGQGAPLAPAFHAAVFSSRDEDRVVLNLGGIANLTGLPRSGAVTGFDCGPGNCLLDLWAATHLGKPFDADGAWAAGGRVIATLLERMLAEPYFAASPPKSTGRELFNQAWLARHLGTGEEPRAVQATLVELTATCVRDAIARHWPGAERAIACGGGACNRALMKRLAELAAPVTVESSARHGVDPGHVEAIAFAWMAKQAIEGKPGSLPAVTGARGPRILGAIYRA